MKYIFWLIMIFTFDSCKLYKSLKYGGIPTQHDYKHFKQRKINNKSPVFNFNYSKIDYKLGYKIGLTNKDLNSTNINLNEFVLTHKTISFLIIKDDTILYEYYKKGFSDTSLVSSFSTIKPFVSTLIGIAKDEGKIKSIEDYIVDYLPELSGKLGFNKIKIRHLLHHTSGIKFTDNPYNPLSDNAEFYWGNSLRKQMLNAKVAENPDLHFKYSSENTLLLGYIIEKVTNGSVSKYMEEKIWTQLGMSAPSYWSIDRSDSLAIEKVFCCFQARTIDFAKFARLYLNRGDWQGKQIISDKWVQTSTHSDTLGNNKHFYNNNWGIGPLKYESYYAVGLYGQFLYVYPEKKIIIVRFGDKDVNYHPNYWTNIFLQIIDQLN